MTLRACALGIALALAAIGCGQFGAVTVTTPPSPFEPPVPQRLGGEGTPQLVETDESGLYRAPAVDPDLYYFRPDDLWYRFAYNRWYQAFSWNGNWFVPEQVPDALKGREPKRKLPSLEAPEEKPGEEEL